MLSFTSVHTRFCTRALMQHAHNVVPTPPQKHNLNKPGAESIVSYLFSLVLPPGMNLISLFSVCLGGLRLPEGPSHAPLHAPCSRRTLHVPRPIKSAALLIQLPLSMHRGADAWKCHGGSTAIRGVRERKRGLNPIKRPSLAAEVTAEIPAGRMSS